MLKRRFQKISLIFGISILIFGMSGCQQSDNSIKLSSAYNIEVSSLSESFPPEGFTCTGLCKNNIDNIFYIGNIGALTQKDNIKSSIEVFADDFGSYIGSIDISKLSNEIRDIQGIAFDYSNNSIWFCSFSENKIYNIDTNGNYMSDISMDNPTGIAYNQKDDSLWVLTYSHLINIDKNGNVLESNKVKIKGQDQIFLAENNRIYFTAGINYDGENFVYEYDLDNNKLSKIYTLVDSFAVEGIWIENGMMYILNDGFYHSAKDARNLICVYKLPD